MAFSFNIWSCGFVKVFGKTRAIGIGCSLKRKLNTCQSSSSVSWTLIGEPRSVKFYHLSLASIFFWTYFYRSCGWGMAHLDQLLLWPMPGSARYVRSTSSRFTGPSGKERIQNTLTVHAICFPAVTHLLWLPQSIFCSSLLVHSQQIQVLLPPANEVWGKVMLLHLSVILSMGVSAPLHAGIPTRPGQTPP